MIRAAICTLACTTLFAVGCNSMGHSSPQGAGNAAVVAGAHTPKEAADNFYAALQAIFRGETAAMNDAWWHDADTTYMGPGGDFRTGWGAIEKEWNTQASQKLGGKVEPTRIHWTQTNEVALLTCIEARMWASRSARRHRSPSVTASGRRSATRPTRSRM